MLRCTNGVWFNLDTAERVYDTVAQRLLSERFSRVANALRLYSVALSTQNTDLAILEFVGSIESLLSIATQELSFRIALLTARFLGDDVDSQRTVFRRMRDAYTVGSKLAHGAKFADKDDEAAIELVEFWVSEIEELARLALCRVIDHRLEGSFDNKTQHEALLTELLFSPNLKAALQTLPPASGVRQPNNRSEPTTAPLAVAIGPSRRHGGRGSGKRR